MGIRVSTSLLSKFSLDAMLRQQGEMSETQLQITSGKALLSPSDNPYASSRALGMHETTAINDQYQVNIQYADNRLATEEGILQGASEALQRIRELAVNANNDSQSQESRRYIREEVLRLRDQLLDLANSTDSSNEFIFSGYKSKTKPFSYNAATNDFDYSGDDGTRYLKVGSSTEVSVNDDGQEVFMAVRDGNGVFATADNAANQGSGIIDPGTEVGTYIPDTYHIKFMPPLSNLPNDPNQYYVTNGQGEVIIAGSGVAAPGANLYATEALFFAAVNLGTDSGINYEEGSTIVGLEQYGIQTSIAGSPAAQAIAGGPPFFPPTQQDEFTIEPSKYQSLFKTVQNFIDTLVRPQREPRDKASFHNAMNRVMVDLDQGIGRVLDTRARIGARLNTVEKQRGINESFNLQMKQTLSQIEDLDYSEAITKLNLQLTAIKASQQTYQKIQSLSLFNYL